MSHLKPELKLYSYTYRRQRGVPGGRRVQAREDACLSDWALHSCLEQLRETLLPQTLIALQKGRIISALSGFQVPISVSMATVTMADTDNI